MRKIISSFAIVAMLLGLNPLVSCPLFAKEGTSKESVNKADTEDREGEEIVDAAQEYEEKNYDIVIDEMFADNIYPSFVIYSMMDKDLANETNLHVRVDEEKAHVKLTIKDNELMEETVYEHDMSEKDEGVYSVAIKWKRAALLDADRPGFINFSVIVEVNGEVKNRFSKTINYRSINEALLGANFDNGYADFSHLFACFVDEDNPRIDEVLRDILEDKKGETFYGYQGESEEDVLKQLKLVWDYFAEEGTHYSSITDTSNSDQKFYTQYVRFFDQVIDNNQANCVDGTCMLASIYRKIGFDVSLVLVPGHAFLAVGGQEKDEDGDPVHLYFLETTMMGSDGATFESAMEEGAREYEENLNKNGNETILVNIARCRELGIKPIGK